jgi:N-hydroxyarylamine O-acetyltransferase
MDCEKYLERITYTGRLAIDEDTLIRLHEHHVFYVPFENLDIHYKKIFDLQPENIYGKVVLHRRGGFCYELNGLFNQLLREVGFRSSIISSRIFDDAGNPGREYDHMSLVVELNDKKYLADVGFGDLFIRPIEIREGIQSDGRNFFSIERFNNDDLMISMSSDGINFFRKYTFNLREVLIEKFYAPCLDKQTNPDSYFVRNTICTKPTPSGRITLFNDKLVERRDGERIEKVINGDEALRAELLKQFGIVIT